MIVNYSETDELPLLNYVKDFYDDDKLVTAIFRTKSKVWKHEDEVRLLSQNHNGKVAIEKNGLVEVMFGFNLGYKERQKVVSVLNDNYNQNPTYREAILSSNKYELEFKSYND